MTRILTRMRPDRATRSYDEELLDRVNRWMSEGVQWCSPIHGRCETNNLFTAGDIQWSPGDAKRQADKDRPAIPMNKLVQVVNAAANREIMNRYVSKIYGRSREDAGWAECQDEFLRWQRDKAEVEHEESVAFRSNISNGYSAIHTYFDPLEDDGRGLIMVEEIPIWGMLWDSRCQKQNLVDRRWHIHGKYISKTEAQEEYGDVSPKARKMFKALSQDIVDANESAKQNADHTPGRWSWDAVSGGRWYNRAEEELFVIETEWRDVKVEYKAAIPTNLELLVNLQSDPQSVVYFSPDPATQELVFSADPPQDPNLIPVTQSLMGSQYLELDLETQSQIRDQLLASTEIQIFETLKELDEFARYYFEVTDLDFEDYAKQKRYSYNYAVISNNVVLETGERRQGFTYEFMTGFPKASREGTDFFGIVDIAKGPQDWRNTLMSLVLVRLATSPKAPFIIESDAVEDINEFNNQVANPRAPIVVPPGFLNSNKFKEMQHPTFPPLERELIGMAENMVGEAAGMSGIDLGAQTDLRRVSGNVVSSVKEASNTILALLFDSLRRYRKRSAKLVLAYMREFYPPAEVAEIVGPEKAQYIDDPQNWPDDVRFNVKIDESPTSATERMELFDFLTRTGTLENWEREGKLPMDVILDWVPLISEYDKKRIREYQQQMMLEASSAQQLQQVQQFMQSTPEGQTLLQQMQQQGLLQQQPAAPAAPTQ